MRLARFCPSPYSQPNMSAQARMVSSPLPLPYSAHTGATVAKSPTPFSSYPRSSTRTSSAAARTSSRMAHDLPDPGWPPNSQFRNASDTSVSSIRGVVANANGLNTSTVPDRSSGQAG